VKKTYQGHENHKFAVGGCFGILNPENDNERGEEQAFIASASEDGRVVLWDVKSKEQVQTLKAHDGVCFWVDVNGRTMVSAGQDTKVRVFRHGVEKAAAGVNGTKEQAARVVAALDDGLEMERDEQRMDIDPALTQDDIKVET
jgi:COMPASS component SWD3